MTYLQLSKGIQQNIILFKSTSHELKLCEMQSMQEGERRREEEAETQRIREISEVEDPIP